MSGRSIFEVRLDTDTADFPQNVAAKRMKVAQVLRDIANRLMKNLPNDDLIDSQKQPYARYGFYMGSLYDQNQ